MGCNVEWFNLALRKKILIKLAASGVCVCFIALQINLAAQSLKNMLLILGRALTGAGCK